MNINEEFPSKFLKAADLNGQMVRVKIDRIMSEQIGDDRKLVAYFVGKEKGMVLNKTNARTIADVYGDETDNWQNAPIEVFAMKVDFQGRMVDGLRVRVPAPARKDPIVPNARARAEQAAGAGDGFDDEIPFAPEFR